MSMTRVPSGGFISGVRDKMAENGREILEQSKTTVDKETRLRILKDRQNEERQRKLEEIKAQALAAQKFKEQKEAERRKRLEELRLKDEQRRLQVEEKKRAINEAERNRLEFILKRNQEREQRIEAKKRNERSSAVFAFGSSTPRMLEPSDLTVSFWGNRRATSIQNITSAAQPSLTRRQSERDLDLAGKKRATSATGLERSTDGSEVVIPAGCASGYMGRRRTDLVPTIPSRDASFSSSRKSLNQSPGRAYSMSRLDQLARPRRPHVPPVTERGHQGGHATNPVTRSMSHLAINAPSSGGRLSLSRSVHHLPDAAGPPQRPVRTTRAVQLREQKMLAKATQAGNAVASSNCSEGMSCITVTVQSCHLQKCLLVVTIFRIVWNFMSLNLQKALRSLDGVDRFVPEIIPIITSSALNFERSFWFGSC
ncbi:unnamed protein product [Acanthoscelides obtectus]|uniref:Uncharacterized protein n=1 Tax=Acanthoscelides obtectus TaxID=200917 RepID=A0A9P0K7Q6_ACAOB|nr:unnamed protein product [Acanthoscelides obtectus]CAK1627504.1 hypothetical protein AOBTE_LOCUS4634 [Acanthoscelides obtectus]